MLIHFSICIHHLGIIPIRLVYFRERDGTALGPFRDLSNTAYSTEQFRSVVELRSVNYTIPAGVVPTPL